MIHEYLALHECLHQIAVSGGTVYRSGYRKGSDAWDMAKRAQDLAAYYRHHDKNVAKRRAAYVANKDRLLARSRELYPAKAAAHNLKGKRHYEISKDVILLRQRESYRDDPVAKNTANKKWRSENVDVCNFYSARKRATKRSATPLWADQSEIKNIYAEARRTGMHVDHIVPLISDVVCGLHCEFNLQLLPPAVNIAKSNNFRIG